MTGAGMTMAVAAKMADATAARIATHHRRRPVRRADTECRAGAGSIVISPHPLALAGIVKLASANAPVRTNSILASVVADSLHSRSTRRQSVTSNPRSPPGTLLREAVDGRVGEDPAGRAARAAHRRAHQGRPGRCVASSPRPRRGRAAAAVPRSRRAGAAPLPRRHRQTGAQHRPQDP
jgi:hypothetical protein